MSPNSLWTKIGLLVDPNPQIEWLAGGSGAGCVVFNLFDSSNVDIYQAVI
jgi:hypothetical protein